MTIKIIRHDPPPAPRPPTTFDIMGLTEEQFDALHYVLDAVQAYATPGTPLHLHANELGRALNSVPVERP